jgi:hypothetical protein
MPIWLLQERLESGLLEVVVCRQRLRQSLLVHHDKRDAVGQRPILVRAASE